jgi:outer membrane lipoprotein-sorting protein
MRFPLRFVLFALALTSARAEELKDILARMDQAAVKFQSFTATMKSTDFTAVLNESEDSYGTVRLRKGKGGTQGIFEFTKPNPRTIHLSGKTLEVFSPKGNTVEIYDAGKHISTADEILLMGFGVSGSELRKNYDVKLAGSEVLNGERTSRLELIPKSEEVRNLTTKIELWIPEGKSNPVQEKLTQPSKNYHLVVFSDVKLNVPLPDSDYSLKLPPGVTKLHPQK